MTTHITFGANPTQHQKVKFRHLKYWSFILYWIFSPVQWKNSSIWHLMSHPSSLFRLLSSHSSGLKLQDSKGFQTIFYDWRVLRCAWIIPDKKTELTFMLFLRQARKEAALYYQISRIISDIFPTRKKHGPKFLFFLSSLISDKTLEPPVGICRP